MDGSRDIEKAEVTGLGNKLDMEREMQVSKRTGTRR